MTRFKTLTTIALVLLSATTAARADAEDASNHGYNSGAYELVCKDRLVVTDAKLRAKLDRKYRNTSEFRFTYNLFHEQAAIIARKGWNKSADITCMVAAGPDTGKPHWLAKAPAAEETVTLEGIDAMAMPRPDPRKSQTDTEARRSLLNQLFSPAPM